MLHELVPLLYQELHRLAARQLGRERKDHILDLNRESHPFIDRRSRIPNRTGMAFEQSSQAAEAATRAVIDRFNDAFNRHDPEVLASLLTEDTVFEDTSPAPDGRRIEGKAAVVAFWRQWFERNPSAQFEAEEIIVSGDRAVVRWMYRKIRNGQPWHLRGVDVFKVRDGRVAAKLAYIKG